MKRREPQFAIQQSAKMCLTAGIKPVSLILPPKMAIQARKSHFFGNVSLASGIDSGTVLRALVDFETGPPCPIFLAEAFISKVEFPKADIDPSIKLSSDFGKCSYPTKTQLLMQLYACHVRQGNTTDRPMQLETPQLIQQLAVQDSANAGS